MTRSVECFDPTEVFFDGSLIERFKDRQPLLYGWAEQLSLAINSGHLNPYLWDGVGHGLIVIDPDINQLQTFLMSASGVLKGQYLNLTVEQFVACSETLIQESLRSIVFLEPGHWLLQSDDDQELSALRVKVRGVLEKICAQNSPIVVVTNAMRFSSTSQQFRYQRVFDRHIFWANPKPLLIAEDLYELVGSEFLDDQLLSDSERLGKILSLDFPSSRKLGLLAATLRRRAILRNKEIGWQDLIDICVNGTGDGFHSNEHLNPENIATHEAGHAVVTMAGSGFKSVPDMVSLVPGNGTAGVAVESYHHTYEKRGGNLTFAEVCQRIRVCLAGRAAEEMEYGIEGCGAYASQNDLENASSMAVHLIMQNGFPAKYDDPVATGSNLFSVPDGSELGETKYYDVQLRGFLENLYQQTKSLLCENKALFELVRRELLQQRYLMREDLVRILAKLRCCG